MAEQKSTCLRCGLCCKGQYCRVPRYEYSDLSPDNLDRILAAHGPAAVQDYIRDNSVRQGDRCKWLIDNADRTTTCMAYNRRSSTCRDFNSDGGCKIWMQVFGIAL